MPANRRFVALATLVILAVVGPVSCGGDDDTTTERSSSGTSSSASSAPAKVAKVTIIEASHTLAFLPLYIADRQGFFDDHGVDVTVTTATASGNAHVAAVLSGEAWGFVGGIEQAILANKKGADLRGVVSLTSRPPWYLVPPAGAAPIASGDVAAALKGKRIAVSAAGGTPHEAALEVLRTVGLDPAKDVSLVEGNDQARAAAVKAGRADFAVTSEPALSNGIAGGVYGDPFVSFSKVLGEYAAIALTVPRATIADDPDVVRNVVAAIVDAERFIADQPDQVVAIARAEFPDIDEATLKSGVDRNLADRLWSTDGTTSARGFQRAADLAASTGGFDAASVQRADVLDDSFLSP